MEGISKKRLKAILHNQILAPKIQSFVQYLIEDECKELQEPWMTLDEFLKSGFEGMCWFSTYHNEVSCAYFYKRGVRESITSNMAWTYDGISHVMPIHKPEPPR